MSRKLRKMRAVRGLNKSMRGKKGVTVDTQASSLSILFKSMLLLAQSPLSLWSRFTSVPVRFCFHIQGTPSLPHALGPTGVPALASPVTSFWNESAGPCDSPSLVSQLQACAPGSTHPPQEPEWFFKNI